VWCSGDAGVSLKLSYDDEQQALQSSIDGFCRRAGTGPLFALEHPLPQGFWSGLADLGVLALGTAAGGGGPLEIAAAMETLGSHGAPGPLVGTFLATALLDDETSVPIVDGRTLVSVGQGTLFPWAPVAGVFVLVEDGRAWTVRSAGDIESMATTASEPWGRFAPVKVDPLGSATIACARAEVAIAAYLVGAAHELLRLATEYARDRVQFNRPIATFQAVSHPLANASTRLNASRILARGAAQRLDAGLDDAPAVAATARLSAVGSASAVANQAHQLFGAMGFTLEGPVAHLSHRIRQVGLLPPDQQRSRSLVLDHVIT
jgi:alkylation response protein AidB-like acyl-CoA dehydrogenase